MSAIRNLCFARGRGPAGTNTNIYTVPEGYVLLFKDLRVYPIGSTAWSYVLYAVAATGGTNVIVANGSMTASQIAEWSGWIAMNGGDNLILNANALDLYYWCSGALLPFAPSLT